MFHTKLVSQVSRFSVIIFYIDNYFELMNEWIEWEFGSNLWFSWKIWSKACQGSLLLFKANHHYFNLIQKKKQISYSWFPVSFSSISRRKTCWRASKGSRSSRSSVCSRIISSHSFLPNRWNPIISYIYALYLWNECLKLENDLRLRHSFNGITLRGSAFEFSTYRFGIKRIHVWNKLASINV